MVPPSLRHTFLPIDRVLPLREEEEHDDEGDQGALRGHVEAEREAEDLDRVKVHDKQVDDEVRDQYLSALTDSIASFLLGKAECCA